MRKEKILIVEDEMIISATIEETLNKIGYDNIETAFTAKKAKEMMTNADYDVVLMDVKLGQGEDGIDVVAEVKKKKDVQVIYVTGNSDDRTVKKAKTTLPSGFITKPINEHDLRIQMELILYKEKLKRIDSEESMQITNLYEGDCTGLTITLNLDGNILALSPLIKKITGRPSHEYLNKKIGVAGFERDFYELLNKILYRSKYTKERTFNGTIYSPFLGQRVVTIEATANGFFSFQFRFTDITEGMYISSYGGNYTEVAVATTNKDILRGFKSITGVIKSARMIAEMPDTNSLKTFFRAGKPCVLMVDVNMEDLKSILQAERDNKEIRKIIMVSPALESGKLNELDKDTYDGYISKTADDATFIETFEKLKTGKKFYDKSVEV